MIFWYGDKNDGITWFDPETVSLVWVSVIIFANYTDSRQKQIYHTKINVVQNKLYRDTDFCIELPRHPIIEFILIKQQAERTIQTQIN